jgi:ribosomal protein S10
MLPFVLILRIKSFHPYYINRFIFLIKTKKNQIEHFGLIKEKLIFLPQKIERYTVLRSPHGDKKSRDQFERRIHQRIITWNFSLKDNKIFLLYSFMSILSKKGVGVDIDAIFVNNPTYKKTGKNVSKK